MKAELHRNSKNSRVVAMVANLKISIKPNTLILYTADIYFIAASLCFSLNKSVYTPKRQVTSLVVGRSTRQCLLCK